MFVLFLRTVIVYAFVIMALRIMGKRQLGELQPNELVVTIIISDIATLSLQDNSMPFMGTLLPIFTLVACEVLLSFLALKSVKFRHAVSGNPIILIRDGSIDQQVMRELRWTIDDLTEQLRILGYYNLDEVSFAIVETSGALTVYPKFQYRPLTPHLMNIQPQSEHANAPPVVLIGDGRISKDGLNYCAVDESWLQKTLQKDGFSLKKVFLMTCDRDLKYKIIGKEKRGK